MVVTDLSVTSRTIAQYIENVTHHSVSASTIRRRLQQSGQSARCPLFGLPLTQNHRRLRRQCEDAEQLRYAPLHWSCFSIMVWGGIGYHSRTPLVRIDGTLNSQHHISKDLEPVVLPYLKGLWPQPYFNKIMRDHAWYALSKGSSSITRLNCFPGRLSLRIFRR
ncbi:transposable element Tcb1 transposase [Trichonephila clavipes]|nr:transposable element Tcb1 transposase [Trichonephila clavipes]